MGLEVKPRRQSHSTQGLDRQQLRLRLWALLMLTCRCSPEAPGVSQNLHHEGCRAAARECGHREGSGSLL